MCDACLGYVFRQFLITCVSASFDDVFRNCFVIGDIFRKLVEM